MSEPSAHQEGLEDRCAWFRDADLGLDYFSLNPAPSPTRLCSECKAISVGDFLSQGYVFRKTYGETCRDSAICAFCMVIQDAVKLSQHYPARAASSNEPQEDHHLRITLDKTEDSDPNNAGFIITEHELDVDDSSTDSGFAGSIAQFDWLSHVTGYLECNSLTMTVAARLGNDLDNETSSFTNTISQCNMRKDLRDMLQDCEEHHTTCTGHQHWRILPSNSYLYLPYRLLRITSVDGELQVNLWRPAGQPVRYVVLSHCWGGHEHMRTTKQNHLLFQQKIPINVLSPTLKEALQITHAAGISYLWVDSLCIVQDDNEEWTREASKMVRPFHNVQSLLVYGAFKAKLSYFNQDHIYANAYFTIAASAWGAGGCFPVRLPEARWAEIPSANDKSRVSICPRPNYFGMWTLEHEPLQKRGWTLQERLLSRRILHCSRFDYYWICREREKCFHRRNASSFFHPEFIDIDFSMPDDVFKLSLLLPTLQGDRDRALTIWYNVLCDYSTRRLTFETDKLVAIEGLAHVFGQWIGSKCIQGLWESDLEYGVLWCPGNRWHRDIDSAGVIRGVKPFKYQGNHRTVPHRSPSWSWANADGLQHQYGGQLKHISRGLDDTKTKFKFANISVANQEEHYSHLRGPLTMHVDASLLKITGRLIRIEKMEEDEDSWLLTASPEKHVITSIFNSGFIMDNHGFSLQTYTSTPGNRAYLIPVVGYCGLVVGRRAGEELYRRIGFFNDLGRIRWESLTHEDTDSDVAENETLQSPDLQQVIDSASDTQSKDGSSLIEARPLESMLSYLERCESWWSEGGNNETIFVC